MCEKLLETQLVTFLPHTHTRTTHTHTKVYNDSLNLSFSTNATSTVSLLEIYGYKRILSFVRLLTGSLSQPFI